MRSKLFVNNSKYSDTIADRFWDKVVDFGNCWLWAGACGKHGYGNFGPVKGLTVRAHCFAFELFHGYKAEEKVLHTCDTPLCCNYNHLFEGTDQVNVDDKLLKGRASGGKKVLSTNDREVIHSMCCDDGLTHQEVATMFGVSRERVGQIARGA